jgi:hypothetical protein
MIWDVPSSKSVQFWDVPLRETEQNSGCPQFCKLHSLVGLGKDINPYMFVIFTFTFEYLKRLQSSEPLHTKMNPTSFLFKSRITVCLESFLPISLIILFDEKVHQSAALFWFRLRDVAILQIF